MHSEPGARAGRGREEEDDTLSWVSTPLEKISGKAFEFMNE